MFFGRYRGVRCGAVPGEWGWFFSSKLGLFFPWRAIAFAITRMYILVIPVIWEFGLELCVDTRRCSHARRGPEFYTDFSGLYVKLWAHRARRLTAKPADKWKMFSLPRVLALVRPVIFHFGCTGPYFFTVRIWTRGGVNCAVLVRCFFSIVFDLFLLQGSCLALFKERVLIGIVGVFFLLNLFLGHSLTDSSSFFVKILLLLFMWSWMALCMVGVAGSNPLQLTCKAFLYAVRFRSSLFLAIFFPKKWRLFWDLYDTVWRVRVYSSGDSRERWSVLLLGLHLFSVVGCRRRVHEPRRLIRLFKNTSHPVLALLVIYGRRGVPTDRPGMGRGDGKNEVVEMRRVNSQFMLLFSI